jgi:ribonucleoside-diphosphate reductase alpha chain
MEQKIKKVRKRDGRIVDFDSSKITNAIFKAFEAVGEPDFKLAKELTEKVIERLKERLSSEEIPQVEQIQDIVEQVLVEEGKAKVAKAYILYRQKRAEIRREKQQILEKIEIDEVDKRFDINALRVLKSRYLKKDSSGKLIESPKQLFERVAVHTTLTSLFYDEKVFRKEKGNPWPKEEFEPENWRGKVKIGRYNLNQFHLEALKRVYDRFNQEGKMKISFSEFFNLLKNGYFDKYQKEIETYYNLMAERKFLPNTPALANFGNYLGMGSACFTLDINDSIESIMDTLKKASIIFKAGGGVGYNFSKLRPEGDFVKTTGGISSGPISFMTLFDKMTDVIKQGGIRRGASMGILDSDHPDIEKFIVAKRGNKQLRNFNISVFIKENFWEYFENKKPYPLINPRTKEIVKYVDPQALFDLIVYQAWESAEPGVIFDEHINKYNPFLETLGPIKCTNPCGELPLYPSESCNLGSINVWAFVKQGAPDIKEKKTEFDWQGFAKIIRLATRFLDNVIDINKYPLPEIEEMTLKTRKIGLGIMGLGDLLYELGIPYNSPEGFNFMEKIMEFLNYHSKLESVELAKERGPFPYFKKSFYQKGKLPFRGREKEEGELPFQEKNEEGLNWDALKEEIKKYGIRNAHTTTSAPTGSISMIAGCSSGIEPVFSLVFEKRVSVGSFYYVDPVFEKTMMKEGLFDDDLIKDVSREEGSIQNLPYIPKKLKRIFVTAMDISAEDHIRALAALQKWTDSSISKTINFPAKATISEMKKAYLLAHQLGCKDLTVFRYKSIKGVLAAGGRKEKKKEEKKEEKLISLKDVKAKGLSVYKEAGSFEGVEGSGSELEKENSSEVELCPKCHTPLIYAEGCKKCPNCGWGLCNSI